VVFSALPLSRDFLWLNLGQPDMLLAVLVGATMWLQQKMSTTTPTDPKQRQQAQMMQWMMPLVFAFLALSFPSGLALYWVATSIVRIVIQYQVTGWGGFTQAAGGEVTKDKKYLKFVASEEERTSADAAADTAARGDELQNKRQEVIYPEKPSKTRYQPGKDRAHRRKK
jgi:YidC/Oxa1 family membrane protein insertase